MKGFPKVLSLELLDRRKDEALRKAGYLTFDGWANRDRHVRKGQKAHEWNSHGKALFHENQTAENYDGYTDDSGDWDSLEEECWNDDWVHHH